MADPRLKKAIDLVTLAGGKDFVSSVIRFNLETGKFESFAATSPDENNFELQGGVGYVVVARRTAFPNSCEFGYT